MIEDLLDGPSNSKYNSQRVAAALHGAKKYEIFPRKIGLPVHLAALTEGVIYNTLPGW